MNTKTLNRQNPSGPHVGTIGAGGTYINACIHAPGGRYRSH